jgi:hypothetical protein
MTTSTEIDVIREALESYQSAKKYSHSYAHLPEARDDITAAWEQADTQLHNALAALDRLQAQAVRSEPAGEVIAIKERVGFGRLEDGKAVRFDHALPVGTKFYLHPAKPAQAVPEGWQLVPKEPTLNMIGNAHQKCDGTFAGDTYKAMLSAAPAPPTTEKEG